MPSPPPLSPPPAGSAVPGPSWIRSSRGSRCCSVQALAPDVQARDQAVHSGTQPQDFSWMHS
ncbi:Hypothetical predicted protein [Marmota monax]|uniref:Uncharacterized protein n=1 Tax=Marmota monax TaxID=9995 RepID=A0A5E4BR46_MARMO|nr:hypothetical protein GHT09_015390 [Marmota monax]VTJ72124.1 Hypothetical predicted protein [Marmota monax]